MAGLRELALVAALAVLAAPPAWAEPDGQRPRPVLTVIAQPYPAPGESFAGEIAARVSTPLAFRMLGQLTTRSVNVGDLVSAGDVLATIDATQARQARDIAAAQLLGAEAQLANAEGSEERQRELLGRGSIPQALYDTVKRSLDAAFSNAQIARANLEKAEEQLGYATLVAGHDGVIIAIGAEVGQTVAAGQMVVVVARTDEREAVIDVPAQLAGSYPPGSEFDITLQALPAVTGRGTVREVSPFADGQTRSLRLRLALSDPPEAFRIGSTVTATARSGHAPAIRLPLSALREAGGETSVWVVDEATGTVGSRAVSVVSRDAASFTPGPEIAAGERVVVAGVNSLTQDQRVSFEPGETR